jgi:hypothetical protein
MTGAEIVTAIRRRADELGIPVGDFAAPLSPNIYTWLRQTEQAATPKAHTLARVAALLAGQEVPPPPPNNFQKGSRQPQRHRATAEPRYDAVPEPLTRDPCFRCGTRADLGCQCRSAA